LRNDVHFVVAPYEADAQLVALLERQLRVPRKPSEPGGIDGAEPGPRKACASCRTKDASESHLEHGQCMM
jgi:hypothetical protein